MAMRKYKRQIAKARLTAMGVGCVNKQMSKEQDGVKNWRRALTGKTGEAALKAQLMLGLKIKQRKDATKSVARRKIRRVGA